MEFVYPSFLFALTALAIPVIIHLFNFKKYKKIIFTNVRFLKEVKEESQSKSQLKHLLVLLARLLALAFLVFAFAQPFIPVKRVNTIYAANAVSVYLDNSFSMSGVKDNLQLLDWGKNIASEVIASYGAKDKFQVLTNNFEGGHQKLRNSDDVGSFIDGIEISSVSRKLSNVMKRQQQALSELDKFNKKIYVISDFQKTTADVNTIKIDSSIAVTFIPLTVDLQENISVDSCWFTNPIRKLNETEKLMIRVRNHSDKKYENISLKLFLNGIQKGITTLNLNANSTADSTVSFTVGFTGFIKGEISIEDYPIQFDNHLFFNYYLPKSINILSIFEIDTIKGLQKLFRSEPRFLLTHQNIKMINYDSFSEQKVIVLSQLTLFSSGLIEELKKFVDNGGTVLLIPSKQIDAVSYNNLSVAMKLPKWEKLDTNRTEIGEINLESNLYANVFEELPKSNMNLPKVLKHYRMKNAEVSFEALLNLQNQDPFLTKYAIGKGGVYICTSSFSTTFTNFEKHALFVPIMYKIVLNSIRSDKLYGTIGNNEKQIIKTIGKNSELIKVTDGNVVEFIPEVRETTHDIGLFFHNQIKKSGNYFILQGIDTLGVASLNYNRNESDLSLLTQEDLLQTTIPNLQIINDASDSFKSKITSLNTATSLWKYCLLLGLLFFGIEIFLLRFWKD